MKRKRRSIPKKNEVKSIPTPKGTISNFFRYLMSTILITAVIACVPLTFVWKQVYITNASVNKGPLKDSLFVLQNEIAALNLVVEQLSSTERIERIAKQSLGFDYPASQEIVIIRSEKKKEKSFVFDSPFWAVLRKSLLSEKG